MNRAFILGITLALVSIEVFAAQLSDAEKEYLAGNYEEALLVAKKLPANDKVFYHLGLIYMKLSNYSQAREYFLKIIHTGASSGLYEQARLKYADSYFIENDMGQAVKLYTELEKQVSTSAYAATIYLRLAQIASKEGRWQDRDKYLKILRTQYPDSAEISLSKSLEEEADYFTVQVGAFGEKKNALNLLKEIQQNFDAYILEDKKNGLTLYKVRIGKFTSRRDAQLVSYQLIKQGYPARIFP